MPADSTLLVRPRSSLGLKYVELTPGKSQGRARRARPSRCARRARRSSSWTTCSACSTTRRASASGTRSNGFGGGFAGRGPGREHRDRGVRAAAHRPRAGRAEPVRPRHAAQPLLRPRSARAAEEVAPVAEEQASLFVNLDTAFTAWASVARPFLQETISESLPSEQLAIEQFPRQRPFIRNNTAFFRELRPGVAVLPHAAPILADAFEAGTDVLPRTIQMNEDLGGRLREARRLRRRPDGARGRRPAHALAEPRCGRRSASSTPARRPATTRRSVSATSRACSPRATRTATTSAS